MSEIQEEINSRISRCAKRKTSFELSDSEGEKAEKFGIEIGKNEKYYSFLKKTLKHLQNQGIHRSRGILLADCHREIRNKMPNWGWNLTDNEIDDIVMLVLKVILFSPQRVSRWKRESSLSYRNVLAN